MGAIEVDDRKIIELYNLLLIKQNTPTMNREILFRGKRTDGKGWVEGDFTTRCPSACCIITDQRFIEVIPSSVGQYSNFGDRKDKRVFEGDKVWCFVDGKKQEQDDTIIFKNGCFWFQRRNCAIIEWLESESFISAGQSTSIEVYSNVHT